MSRKIRREIGTVRPLSDKSKLLWERYWGPMNGAAQALNAAIGNTQNLLASIIMEMEGLDPTKHSLDVENMRIVARPQPSEIAQLTGKNDGKMGE